MVSFDIIVKFKQNKNIHRNPEPNCSVELAIEYAVEQTIARNTSAINVFLTTRQTYC